MSSIARSLKLKMTLVLRTLLDKQWVGGIGFHSLSYTTNTVDSDMFAFINFYLCSKISLPCKFTFLANIDLLKASYIVVLRDFTEGL